MQMCQLEGRALASGFGDFIAKESNPFGSMVASRRDEFQAKTIG